MSARGKYLVNPAPFVMGVFNPMKKNKKKHRKKNAQSKAGIRLLRKPVRNSHRKRKHKRSTRKNPLQFKHILVENSHRKKRRRRNKVSHRKYSTSSRSLNPMKKRRSKKSHRRNPSRRHHRKNSRRMRNPIGVVSDIFNPNMLTIAGAAIATNVGTNIVMNRLVVGDSTGKRPFDLPGVDFTVPAAQFYSKNGYILAFYKLVLGGAVGYFLRNQAPRASQGILLGATITAGSDIFRTAGIINTQGTIGSIPGVSRGIGRGVGRNFPANGVGLLPGTSTQFTGPAQSFLNANSVPRPRGMGAMVGPQMVRNTEGQVEGAFRGAN